ncbi:MAG: bifunctional folylpolyglutamate synthase/dihydrofolate synthase [Alphaproteobacteria bacterium]|nr:bifunctional folylpolyglutamate synthase/dihydrofolate synthase [Alphaproteobacteria bacterium]
MLEKTESVLQRLVDLHPKKIDLSLGRVGELLSKLGRPQEKLPPVVHVAGTNGKGSTIAFLRAFLEAAGYRVHVYTSPHLVNFRERVCLAGRIIDDGELVELLEECETVNDGRPITFFEITTAAAFLAFSRVPADILLLETGLGGRLDATNMVPKPALTAITPISIDHMQFLGSTLAAIAGEKSGILKSGVTGVIAPQEPEAQAVIEAQAKEVGAPLHSFARDWNVRPLSSQSPDTSTVTVAMHFEGGRLSVNLPAPGLAGRHQMFNAATALACLEYLDAFPVDEAALARGLETVDWPGRLQRIIRGPLVDELGEGWELWIDGGHNPAAGDILAVAAKSWGSVPLDMVFGMLNSKNPGGFLAPLAPYLRRVRAVAIPGENASFTAAEAAAAGHVEGIEPTPAESLEAALHGLVAAAAGEEPGRILVCGSLYLAGAVLRENG